MCLLGVESIRGLGRVGARVTLCGAGGRRRERLRRGAAAVISVRRILREWQGPIEKLKLCR